MSIQEINEMVKNAPADSAQQNGDTAGQRIQLIVFKLVGEEYAMPIEQIKEVVITPSIARVPRTPGYIKGVANIRGNVIAIMDLEEKFHLKEPDEEGSEENRGNFTLVIESDDHKIGILVREVPNTLNTTVSAIDHSTEVMQYSSLDGDSITGVVKVNDRMIILIDIMKMVSSEDMSNINKRQN